MRRLISLCTLMLVCLLLPVRASADSLYEWNRSCRRKTICETKIYSGGDTNRLKAVIPANTYVKVHGGATDKWVEISYKTASGQSGIGLADPKCIGSAVISFTDANGDRRGIQELQYYEMYGNNPVPGATMDGPYPGYSDYTQIDPNGSAGESENKSESNGKTEENVRPAPAPTPDSSKSSTKQNGSKTNSSTKKKSTEKQVESAETTVPIGLVRLGVHTSVILHEGREVEVPTAELQFYTDVPEGKRIASILAPRAGRCYLRAKASDKGDILDKCPAGTVVQVIKYGKSYCQIVYEGQVGYVQTACLTFLDPAADILGTTVLTYNGKATGAAQVPVRNDRSNESASVVKLRSGTEVTVLGKDGSWYEVAYQGLHGYVHKNYMSAEIQ